MKSQNLSKRTIAQLKEHYEIEKELANRLRNSSKQQRRILYSSVHDELFRRLPHHPLLRKKSSPAETAKRISLQMLFLRRFLGPDSVFLEIGAGDCALSFEVSKFVKSVHALEVSEEIAANSTPPTNFRLIVSDGTSVPLPENSVSVAYSNQLMEHLHPDDALEQLENIYKVLAPSGVYVCITPNRLNGPHDISRLFDSVPKGFHLKEYTASELSSLFTKIGFSKVRVYAGGKGFYATFGSFTIRLFEFLLALLPYSVRKASMRVFPFRLIGTIRIVGSK